METMPEVIINNQGSIVILTPTTPEASSWFVMNLPEDCVRWAGGYVVEPRYVDDILRGLQDDGFGF